MICCYIYQIIIFSDSQLQQQIKSQQMEQQKHQQNAFFGKFTIFLLIKTAQNSYGVKNSDYMRYRRYCSRKIQKLRKSMNYKFGNRVKFDKKKNIVHDRINDPRILQIALFEVEKYWAWANQAKFSQSHKPSQKSRIRFFSAKKLHRAWNWSKKLKQICKEKTENQTNLEAQAYLSLMEGLYEFQCQKWQKAQAKLIECRQIIKDLARVSDTMTERILVQKIDQIEQNIKYCSFKQSSRQMSIQQIMQMREKGDTNVSDLMENLATRRLQAINLQEKGQIRFGNERYPMKQQKITVQKSRIDQQLKSLVDLKKRSQQNNEDQKMYEQLLSFYSQIVLLIEQAIKMTDKAKDDTHKYTQGEIQILKKISLLFQETKMNVFIDRNQTIFRHSFYFYQRHITDRKSSPQTLSKLLTNIISIYNSLTDIEKQKNQISNTFDPQPIQKIDAKVFYLRTLRLALVGQVYFNNQKIKQAYSLWGQGDRCLKILDDNEKMDRHQLIVPLKKIQEIIKVGRMRCVIRNYQAEENAKQDVTNKVQDMAIQEKQAALDLQEISLEKLVIENKKDVKLETLSKITIMELPGKLQFLPPRPFFFNIFDAQLEYPSLQNKNQQKGKSVWWNRFFG